MKKKYFDIHNVEIDIENNKQYLHKAEEVKKILSVKTCLFREPKNENFPVKLNRHAKIISIDIPKIYPLFWVFKERR